MTCGVLTSPENGAGKFSGRKNVNISRKNWVPELCKSKKICVQWNSCITPNKKIQNHWEPPYKLCLKKACLLCSPPSSALFMGWLFSLGSPIVDIHRVKTRLETGVPRSPESDAPRSSLYAPPHFPRNQPVPATYSGQYLKRASVVAEGINRNRNTLSGRRVTASRVSMLVILHFQVNRLL